MWIVLEYVSTKNREHKMPSHRCLLLTGIHCWLMQHVLTGYQFSPHESEHKLHLSPTPHVPKSCFPLKQNPLKRGPLTSWSIRLVPAAPSSIEVSIWKYHHDPDINQLAPRGGEWRAGPTLKSSMRRISTYSDSDSPY